MGMQLIYYFFHSDSQSLQIHVSKPGRGQASRSRGKQLRAEYGPTFTSLWTSLRPPQGPDVCLPRVITFRRGDEVARAVIGPLTKTRWVCVVMVV